MILSTTSSGVYVMSSQVTGRTLQFTVARSATRLSSRLRSARGRGGVVTDPSTEPRLRECAVDPVGHANPTSRGTAEPA